MMSQPHTICSNCKHHGQCVLESNGLHTRYFCEEFAFEPHSVNGSTKPPVAPVSQVYNQATGLCGTCDHVRHCSLVSTETVILTCEQYQ